MPLTAPAGLPPAAALHETLAALIAHAAGPTRAAFADALSLLTHGAAATWRAGVLAVPAAVGSPVVYPVRHAPGRAPLPWVCPCPVGAAGWPCAHAALAEACLATWDRLGADDLPFADPPAALVPAAAAALADLQRLQAQGVAVDAATLARLAAALDTGAGRRP